MMPGAISNRTLDHLDAFLDRCRFMALAAAIRGVLPVVSTRFRRWTLGIACLFAAPGITAATLQISPVMLEFAADANASGLTLRDPADTPLYGQVRVFRWTQEDGQDRLSATDDLVASPPIIKISPHSDQLVRLVRRSMAPSATEQSYRLLIDEVPQQADVAQGVRIQLRYSVPVFVPSTATPGQADHAQTDLSWTMWKKDDHWVLAIRNAGRTHAQISAITLYDARDGAHVLSKGLLGYALAGSGRSWETLIPADTLFAGHVKLHATVNAVTMDTDATVLPEK